MFSNQFIYQLPVSKKGKCLFAFLYPILTKSFPIYSINQLPYPFPQIPILINRRFYLLPLFNLYSPGFEPPTSRSASHCHYHLTTKALDARALIFLLIISSSPSGSSHTNFNLFIHKHKF